LKTIERINLKDIHDEDKISESGTNTVSNESPRTNTVTHKYTKQSKVPKLRKNTLEVEPKFNDFQSNPFFPDYLHRPKKREISQKIDESGVELNYIEQQRKSKQSKQIVSPSSKLFGKEQRAQNYAQKSFTSRVKTHNKYDNSVFSREDFASSKSDTISEQPTDYSKNKGKVQFYRRIIWPI
jgi:hypothetical protein